VRIEIYELRRESDGFVIDETRPVAVITVKDGIGAFHLHDKRKEKTLRDIFDNPVTSFVAGGKALDGACWDAVTTCPAWSMEAIQRILEDQLRGHNLGARSLATPHQK